MSTTLAMKNAKERNHHKQRLTPNGTLFEFLASPNENRVRDLPHPRHDSPWGCCPSTATPTSSSSMFSMGLSKHSSSETAIRGG
jgi:hypothetical protein